MKHQHRSSIGALIIFVLLTAPAAAMEVSLLVRNAETANPIGSARVRLIFNPASVAADTLIGYTDAGGLLTLHHDLVSTVPDVPMLAVSRPYPNPAGSTTCFDIQGPDKAVADLSLDLYDVRGRLVGRREPGAGSPALRRPLAAGTYLYRVREGGDVRATGKLTVAGRLENVEFKRTGGPVGAKAGADALEILVLADGYEDGVAGLTLADGTHDLFFDLVPAAVLTLTGSPNPVAANQPVTFTASVTRPWGTPPTGTVTFSFGAPPATIDGCEAVPLVDGAATCLHIFTTAPDSIAVTARYEGAGGAGPGAVAVVVQAVQVPVTLTIVPPAAGAVLNAPYTVTWTLDVAEGYAAPAAPTGTVTISDGEGNSCSADVAAGACTLVAAVNLDTYCYPKTLTGTYGGDLWFSDVSSQADFSVSAGWCEQCIAYIDNIRARADAVGATDPSALYGIIVYSCEEYTQDCGDIRLNCQIMVYPNAYFIADEIAYLSTSEFICMMLSYCSNGSVTRELSRDDPIPFNPQAMIAFGLAESTPVTLQIYDASGRAVRTLMDGETLEAGTHEVAWDRRDDAGRPLAAGIYQYRLDAGSITESRRMVLYR